MSFSEEEIQYILTQKEEAKKIRETYSAFQLFLEFNVDYLSTVDEVVHLQQDYSRIKRIEDPIATVRFPRTPDIERPATPTEDWLVLFTRDFRKGISSLDKKVKGRVLEGISEMSKDPVRKIGNTQIPLGGELEGQWRRRLGNFRLIYFPDIEPKIIHLLAIGSRGKIYR